MRRASDKGRNLSEDDASKPEALSAASKESWASGAARREAEARGRGMFFTQGARSEADRRARGELPERRSRSAAIAASKRFYERSAADGAEGVKRSEGNSKSMCQARTEVLARCEAARRTKARTGAELAPGFPWRRLGSAATLRSGRTGEERNRASFLRPSAATAQMANDERVRS